MFAVSDLTDEHLPPQCLFPESARGDLPVFVACRKCNRDWSKWIEYFRDALVKCLVGEAKLKPLDELREAVARAEKNRREHGLRESPIDVVRKGVQAPFRVWAMRDVHQLDVARINASACHIVSGLYFVETGQYLDLSARICTTVAAPLDPAADVAAWALATAPKQARGSFAHGNFTYTWIVQDDKIFSEWLLSFYGLVYFYGFTYHRERPFIDSRFFGERMTPGGTVLEGLVDGRARLESQLAREHTAVRRPYPH